MIEERASKPFNESLRAGSLKGWSLLAGYCVLFGLGTILLPGCKNRSSESAGLVPFTHALQVEEGLIEDHIQYRCHLWPKERDILYFPRSGKVQLIQVKEGQIVQRGQVLARLEPPKNTVEVDTTLRAPGHGLLVQVLCAVGQSVVGQGVFVHPTEAMLFAPEGDFSFQFSLANHEAQRLKTSRSVRLVCRGMEPVPAVASFVQESPSRTRVLLECEADLPGSMGTPAHAEFVLEARIGPRIPSNAVFYHDDQLCVWRDNQGQIERTPVVVGLANESWIEIREGLLHGETVLCPTPPISQER